MFFASLLQPYEIWSGFPKETIKPPYYRMSIEFQMVTVLLIIRYGFGMESAVLPSNSTEKRGTWTMNLMTKELATINLFIIWIIIFGGIVFLKIVKNRLED